MHSRKKSRQTGILVSEPQPDIRSSTSTITLSRIRKRTYISLAKRNLARKYDNYVLDCRLGKSNEGNPGDKESERREDEEEEGEKERELGRWSIRVHDGSRPLR